jgi:phage recombination protein Bet
MSTAIQNAPAVHEKPGLIEAFAGQYNIKPANVLPVLKDTILPGGKASDEQVQAFLVVCNEYGLNPFTKEIYAFPAKGGGVQSVIGIDGWIKLVHRQKQLDGIQFIENRGETGRVESITCRIARKDMGREIECTEYMAECARNTDPWKQYPIRMLRHKAMIQCARLAFGLSGVMDQDEYEQMIETEATVVEDHDSTAGRVRDKVRKKKRKQKSKTEDSASEVVMSDEEKKEAEKRKTDLKKQAESLQNENNEEKKQEPDDDEETKHPKAYEKLCRAYDVHSEQVDESLRAVGLPSLLDIVPQDLDNDDVKLLKRAYAKYIKLTTEG